MIMLSREFASLVAPCARVKAWLAESSANPALTPALDALSFAESESNKAAWASVAAFSDCSLSEPISCPDSWLVCTKHSSSPANALISTSVDSFASLSFRSSIGPNHFHSPPRLHHFVKSAMYSPKHATATMPEEQYSAHSQIVSLNERDATSEAVRAILDHRRTERRVLLFLLALITVFLASWR